MLHALNKKTVLSGSFIAMSVMFAIVVFYANPLIDGGNGSSLLKLQLAFDRQSGIAILDSWGPGGATRFRLWIFTDYLYAVSYAVFFASLLAILVVKKGKQNIFGYRLAVYLGLIAGLLDWIENTLEIIFVNNAAAFPETLFFLHSMVAVAKWAVLPIALIYIAVLLLTRNNSTS